MRRPLELHRPACLLAAMAALALAAACGDEAGTPGGDGPADLDATLAPDASVAPASDGAPAGGVADLEACESDTDCENPASDCVSVYPLRSQRLCLPSCAGGGTAACPFNTVCYHPGEGSLPPNLEPMKDHCWFSLCGEQVSAASVTGGLCELGEEFGAAGADRLPGWCWPVSDGQLGVCYEVGELPSGATCDLETQVRGGANCDRLSLCTGPEDATVGVCRTRCDPRTILTRDGGNSGCPAEQDCLDSSYVTTIVDGTEILARQATIGFCTEELTACRLLGGPDACPPLEIPDPSSDGGVGPVDGGGAVKLVPQGCLPTNPVRPTGMCHESGAGAIPAGEVCPDPVEDTGDAEECVAGTLCVGETAGGDVDAGPRWQGACATTCDLAGGEVSCAGDAACTALVWDEGLDGVYDTADDNLTATWGVCLAPAPAP